MIGLAIICVILLMPQYKMYHLISRGVYYQYTPLYNESDSLAQVDWGMILKYSIPILIIGSLLIYTLRDKKK